MNWLVKEEPTNYTFDALVRDGRTSWTGVRNPVAQKNIKAMKKGDRVLFYNTGDVKAVIGVAQVAKEAYPDPTDKGGKMQAVDITPVKKLKSPVTLAAVKADKRFATHPLVRIPRLSVMPFTDEEFECIQEMSSASPA